MTNGEDHKYPRLFVPVALGENTEIPLSSAQAHYLKNVLRQSEGSYVRVFNGKDGEWLSTVSSFTKKSGDAHCIKQIRALPKQETSEIHLIFAPIKKARMDFLIEKAVELGVSELHPVISERTEVRKLNLERICAQIIEAAEQCERLDVPKFHKPTSLREKLSYWTEEMANIPLLAAIERDAGAVPLRHLNPPPAPCSALIGPEGGFTENEIQILKKIPFVTPVSLGPNILRAETAALKILSYIAA